jgi:hypothetical protein
MKSVRIGPVKQHQGTNADKQKIELFNKIEQLNLKQKK